MSTKKLLKHVGVMSIITLLSRILGLVREIVRASLLGTSYLNDAYILAFALPNLFRRLTAEGAMVNAFIPIFTRIKENEGDEKAGKFAGSFFTLLAVVITLFAVIFILLAPWLIEYFFAIGFSAEPLQLTIFLTRVMFCYIVFISLAALCQGILNSHSVFWVSSFTPILLNITIISSAWFFFSKLENPTYGFAIGVVLGGIIQLGFQIPFVKKQKTPLLNSFSFSDPQIREVGKLMLPGIFGVGIYQINIVVSNMIATTLREGSLSALSFSNRLLELVLGVFIVSVATVLLPHLSSQFNNQEFEKIKKTLSDSLKLVSFVSLPVIAGILAIDKEIVSLLFLRGKFDQNSLLMTVQALTFHIPGLIFIGWNRVILSAFYAGKNFKTPVKIAAIVMIINLTGCLFFSKYLSHAGIALASTLSQMAQTLLLLFYFDRMIIKGFIEKTIVKSLLINGFNSVLMYLAVDQFKLLLDGTILPIWTKATILIIAGIASFIVFSFVLKSAELKEILNLVKKKR